MNEQLVRKFLRAFEDVFDQDWKYTQERLGICPNTKEQIQQEINGETIPFIAYNGTFLHPKVEDEIENWGYRGHLLETYRELKKALE